MCRYRFREDAAAEDREDCKVFGKARLPEDVKVVQIVAGDGFTLCLTDRGAVWGFGQFKDEVGHFIMTDVVVISPWNKCLLSSCQDAQLIAPADSSLQIDGHSIAIAMASTSV